MYVVLDEHIPIDAELVGARAHERERSHARFLGVKRLIIPRENDKDLVDVPDEVKNKLEIILVDNIDEVYAAALL